MLRRYISPLLLLMAFGLPALAHADTFTFSASGSGGGFTGSGTLVTTNNGNGSYTITGISGSGITGLIAPGTFRNNDNLLFPSATSLIDTNGFAFTDLMGNTAYSVDIFSNGSGGYNAFITDSDRFSQTVPVTFAVANSSVTPEPSSFVLLGTGVLGVLGAARRKYRKA